MLAQEKGCFGSLDFYWVYFGGGVKYARIIDYLSNVHVTREGMGMIQGARVILNPDNCAGRGKGKFGLLRFCEPSCQLCGWDADILRSRRKWVSDILQQPTMKRRTRYHEKRRSSVMLAGLSNPLKSLMLWWLKVLFAKWVNVLQKNEQSILAEKSRNA